MNKKVFVDTAYWIARTNPKDRWHYAARRAMRGLGKVRLVTTEEVLSEFLTGFSKRGAYLRDAAARIVDEITRNPDIEVLPQSHESFTTALELFRQRSDKGYSMQDCASMHAMRTLGISEVLSSDLHFEQEGFTALVK